MIIYKNTAKGFRDDVDKNTIVEKMDNCFIETLGHSVSDNEKRSWNNSLNFMEKIVRLSKIPNDCGILLEYNIPSTSKRIDFIAAGHDQNNKKKLIIVELKQWEKAEPTDLDCLVKTYVGGGNRIVSHPAYQAHSYKCFLTDMNSAVEEKDITPVSCAYLHNYRRHDPEPLVEGQYKALCADTPVFFQQDSQKLEAFFSKEISKGDGMGILDEIKNGKIRPSKKLIDFISKLYKGNKVYTLLDEQQVAYANIMKNALSAKDKTVIIINGGPGTGKSVVAINAFVNLLQHGKNVCYVAPNAAFREAIIDTLCRSNTEKKKKASELFSGSSAFFDKPENLYDALIVDEAHRLKGKGAYMYKGESQVRDIIHAARVSIFFIDDCQRIRLDDEGTRSKIKEEAAAAGASVVEVHLEAQFRCSGAEGYLNWVDNTLQIAETANFDGWDQEAYDFKIVDDPNEVESYVQQKCTEGFKARMLAGYAWPWTSAKDGNPDANVNDVKLPEYNFERPWNSRKTSQKWSIDSSTINQIGCVHTSQGLEFDYAGVIIGKDLCYNPETHQVQGDFNHYKDTAGKKGLKNNPEKLTMYLKNIYKILLSRGMKGCCVFCYDKNLQEYFKERLQHNR